MGPDPPLYGLNMVVCEVASLVLLVCGIRVVNADFYSSLFRLILE